MRNRTKANQVGVTIHEGTRSSQENLTGPCAFVVSNLDPHCFPGEFDKYRTGSEPGSPCGQPAWGGGSDPGKDSP